MRRPVLDDPRLAGYILEPLAGGWSGETFLAAPSDGRGEDSRGEHRLAVRYFADARHAPGAAGIQAALLHLVRDVVPVPAVRQVHDGDADLPGVLVTELLPGERGDLALARRAGGDGDAGRRATDLRTLGRALGFVAGTLAAFPMPQAGMFADAGLRIDPFPLWLPEWVDTHAPQLTENGWPDGEVAALRAVAERAASDLDGAPPSLVHSDLNPKNVLVDPMTLQVTGVLDWEFAHAGHPATDLGNLLRFDREPAYVEGVLDGYFAGLDGDAATGAEAATGTEADTAAGVDTDTSTAASVRSGAGEPDRRRATDLARAADLVALVDLAARRAANPVVHRARAHLRAIARSGDVHAVP
ncbi:phosphotransferase family protein [Promicromonospora panici]|uniref:phosphotransferase family protein n=1 Tax=Promicromonospora panici TaxID=2219658 RepID=UPI00101BC1BD|nr:phosphotransferase [Promicromonospora panici]